MSQAAPRRPPWLDGRTRRSGAQRRAQDMRAEARMVQRLLKCFAQLQHRGCGSTALGKALAMALQPSVAEAPLVAPERPPGTFYAKAQSYAAPATPSYAPPAYEAPASTAFAQPAYVAAPATDSEAPRTTSCTESLSMQPSVSAELLHLFRPGEVGFVDACLGGFKPRTLNERQRLAKATTAIDILNLFPVKGNG